MAVRPRIEHLPAALRVHADNADRLEKIALAVPRTKKPLTITKLGNPANGDGILFECEKWDPQDPKNQHNKPTRGHKIYRQRTCNSWALVNKNGRMVIPACVVGNEPNDHVYFLIGFMYPLSAGARQVSRAVAGFTPLYADRSHPDVWQMDVRFWRVKVGTPYAGELVVYGCEAKECTIFPSATLKNVEYVVQNPDPEYQPFCEAMFARWVVPAAYSQVKPLGPWEDLDLTQPRPYYINDWSWTMMRHEEGVRAHPDDPQRKAMLGRCRDRDQEKGERRAPRTERQWLAIRDEECDSGDDEMGDSDAGSILDDVERGLPTSASWDPVTKKSTTPSGNEPHPNPEVVRELQERNRRWDEAHEGPAAGRGRGGARGGGRGAGRSEVERGGAPNAARGAGPGRGATVGRGGSSAGERGSGRGGRGGRVVHQGATRGTTRGRGGGVAAPQAQGEQGDRALQAGSASAAAEVNPATSTSPTMSAGTGAGARGGPAGPAEVERRDDAMEVDPSGPAADAPGERDVAMENSGATQPPPPASSDATHITSGPSQAGAAPLVGYESQGQSTSGPSSATSSQAVDQALATGSATASGSSAGGALESWIDPSLLGATAAQPLPTHVAPSQIMPPPRFPPISLFARVPAPGSSTQRNGLRGARGQSSEIDRDYSVGLDLE